MVLRKGWWLKRPPGKIKSSKQWRVKSCLALGLIWRVAVFVVSCLIPSLPHTCCNKDSTFTTWDPNATFTLTLTTKRALWTWMISVTCMWMSIECEWQINVWNLISFFLELIWLERRARQFGWCAFLLILCPSWSSSPWPERIGCMHALVAGGACFCLSSQPLFLFCEQRVIFTRVFTMKCRSSNAF